MHIWTLLLMLSGSPVAATPPADVRIEWTGGAAPVEVVAGKAVELPYAVRNVGGQHAFAVIVRGYTSLGPIGDPVRLQPGPEAGKRFERKLSFVPAAGMREVCVEAALQNRNRDDPLDPTPNDNRICRMVRVKEKS